MEKIFEQALLYDFYGELLTEHQRSIYEDAVCNDLSLGEIAEANGISRQGVHDLLKRCDKILRDYEDKLHLVERFAKAKLQLAEIVELTRSDMPLADQKQNAPRMNEGCVVAADVPERNEECSAAADVPEVNRECAATVDIPLETIHSIEERMKRIRELAGQLQDEL